MAAAARIRGTRGPDRLQAANGVYDTVSCGLGHDLATVDGFDRAARDCETVTRGASRDPYRNAESQHETEVEPDSAAFGKTVVAVFQVGRIFDGGSHNIGFAVSRDSGRTWSRGFLHGLGPRVSDPSIAYDRRHGVWLVTSLVFGGDGSSIRVSRSRDGVHWGNPVVAIATSTQLGQDKEWVACDGWPASPYYGRCYLSYSDVLGDQVVTQASADGGLTWSAPATAAGSPGRASIRGAYAPGVQPLVLPSGRVVVAYYDEGRLSALRSDDGGATWTARLAVAPARYRSHRGIRAAPLPSSAVSSDGRAYVAWTDCSFHPGCGFNDIVYTSSTDGIAWTPLTRIPTGGADAELPGLDADPSRPGRLALAYYVLRGASLDVRFVSSRDAGASWSRPQLLSSRPVPVAGIARTSQGSMVGDYISTSFAGGRAVPVFVLATRPSRGRLREGTFATSLPVR
ncbi:MAG TPA: exo-alpha-sialidase [Gaiellaceae bacterium]|nr:exo-alpha-sialidase [Gaiellaceae bacterium]